jgi:phage-related minor tail protein
MGSADGIKEALKKLTATMEKMQASQETMQASLDKLAPLAPVAGERTL